MKKDFLKLCFPTLKYRRLRGNMIEVFKIINGYHDINVAPNLILNTVCLKKPNS